MRSIQTGAEAMVDECQRSEESENMLAYSHLTSKETVRKAICPFVLITPTRTPLKVPYII